MNLRISRYTLRDALLLPSALFFAHVGEEPHRAAQRRRGAGRLLALCAKPAAWRLTGMLGPQEDAFTLPLLPLLAVIACALLWRFLSGIGGCFYQNEDSTVQTPSFTPCLTTAGPYTFRVRPMR